MPGVAGGREGALTPCASPGHCAALGFAQSAARAGPAGAGAAPGPEGRGLLRFLDRDRPDWPRPHLLDSFLYFAQALYF